MSSARETRPEDVHQALARALQSAAAAPSWRTVCVCARKLCPLPTTTCATQGHARVHMSCVCAPAGRSSAAQRSAQRSATRAHLSSTQKRGLVPPAGSAARAAQHTPPCPRAAPGARPPPSSDSGGAAAASGGSSSSSSSKGGGRGSRVRGEGAARRACRARGAICGAAARR